MTNRWLVAALLGAHLFLALFQVDRIEFFGEDEATAVVDAARTVLGLKDGDPQNIVTLEFAPHPPVRYLVLLPFLTLFGANETSVFFPHAIASVVVFWLILRIGRTFLGPAGLVFLIVIYGASSAYGLNRSLIGAGWFIALLLASFYQTEVYAQRAERRSLIASWLALTIAVLTFLEGVLFAFYVFFRTLFAHTPPRFLGGLGRSFAAVPPIRRRRDAIIVPALVFVLPLALYVGIFWLRPSLEIGGAVGPLQHLVTRDFGAPDENGIVEWARGYLLTFSPAWLAIVIPGVALALRRRNLRQVPPVLWRLMAFFGLHAICWWFFMSHVCGHTLQHYPVIMLLGAFGLESLYRGLTLRASRLVFSAALAALAVGSAAYAYRTFTDANPVKRPQLGLVSFGHNRCGVNSAHKVGFKSAAYLMRLQSDDSDRLLTNAGGGPSEYLLGRPSPPLDLKTARTLLQLGRGSDIYGRYSVRFVAISPMSDVDPQLTRLLWESSRPAFTLRRRDGTPSLHVWDLRGTNTSTRFIRDDEFDASFDRQFGSLEARFSAWRKSAPRVSSGWLSRPVPLLWDQASALSTVLSSPLSRRFSPCSFSVFRFPFSVFERPVS